MNVELSATELEVCWKQLQPAELPVVLDVPVLGHTDTQRRQLVTDTLDGLRARGLFGPRGVHSDLADILITLAECRWAVEAWLLLDRPVRALAACRGEVGAVATLEREQVRRTSCPPHFLLAELVRLPGLKAGPGYSVTVRAENLDAAATLAGHDMPRLAEELIRRGERGDDAHELARMCAQHRHLGQFGVLVRDHLGRQSPGRRVVGLHATPAGWYSQLRRIGHGGTFVTITPASPAVVTAQVRDLLTETRHLTREWRYEL